MALHPGSPGFFYACKKIKRLFDIMLNICLIEY
ncbi:MAG: hypothetical protein RLZZ237_4096 [Pseudomonadota bacterium]|jgi:hypothetical protein